MEPTQKLIYDRSFKDVQRVAELNRKISAGSASAEEVQEWFSAKGALNYEDLNRIESWTEFLSNQLKSYGYNAPITKRAEQTYTYYKKLEPGDEPVARLPEGYRELTYIESTGTQYVNTDTCATQNYKVECDVELTAVGSTYTLFGHYVDATDRFAAVSLSATSWRAWCGNIQNNFAGDCTGRQLVALSGKGMTAGDTSTTFSSSSFSANIPVFVFALNKSGSAAYLTSMKLYGFKIYDNDVLIRDFIPCRNSSGDVGLYDLVTKQFFGNAGTGAFMQGEAVVELPEGFERAHYIESTGTQYINTGYALSNNSRVVVGADLTNYSANTYGNSFFGARSSDGSNAFLVICGTSANANWTIMYGNNSGNATIAAAGRHEIDFNKNVCIIDGKSVSITASSFNCAYPCFLFTDNRGGTANTGNNSRLKLYACQIYDNGAIVRDYVPCKDGTGVFGLYDLVEGKFYGNSGTGAFLGTVKRKLPEGYTQVDYIESSGTQYIDTKVAIAASESPTIRVECTCEWINATGDNGMGYASGGCIVWFGCYQGYIYYGNGTGDTKLTNAIYEGGKVTYIYDTYQGEFSVSGLVELTGLTFNQPKTTGNFLLPLRGDGVVIYDTKMYDKGVLIRDYVPCIDPQGAVGLYDALNNVFYKNASGNAFLTGELIEYVEPAPEQPSGPAMNTVTYTDWRVWDIPNLAEINRIRDNVNSLRGGFYNLSDWREIARKNNPNYEDVNSLEWDMQTIYNWLKLMVLNFKYSGEVYAGEAW